MTAVMLTMLIGLGVWQLNRLTWKRAILAEIDHAEASPAIPLPTHPGRFQKVGVSGVFRAGTTLLYGAEVRDTLQGPQMGAQLIQPLIRKDGPPVLIDRGWMPTTAADAPSAPTAEPVSVEGYIRTAEHPGPFSPKDDPGLHRVYTLDPQAMAAALNLPQVAPFTLVVLGSAADNAYPAPATALPRPPNDHLSYAITWFGLAVVLAVVFTIWARRVILGQDPQPE